MQEGSTTYPDGAVGSGHFCSDPPLVHPAARPHDSASQRLSVCLSLSLSVREFRASQVNRIVQEVESVEAQPARCRGDAAGTRVAPGCALSLFYPIGVCFSVYACFSE